MAKKPKKRKDPIDEWDFDEDDEDDDDDDDDDDEDEWTDEIFAVRFPQTGKFSEKRYCYLINEDDDTEYEIGDWVIVKVANEEKVVLITADPFDYDPEYESKLITDLEFKKATKYIMRKATKDEEYRTKNKYYLN